MPQFYGSQRLFWYLIVAVTLNSASIAVLTYFLYMRAKAGSTAVYHGRSARFLLPRRTRILVSRGTRSSASCGPTGASSRRRSCLYLHRRRRR